MMLARQLTSQRRIVSSSWWLSAVTQGAWLQVLDANGQGMFAFIHHILPRVDQFGAPRKRAVSNDTDSPKLQLLGVTNVLAS